MTDFSEPLKRLYLNVDRLNQLIERIPRTIEPLLLVQLQDTAHSLRVWVDAIAVDVDYRDDGDETDLPT
jgi:hypothetical protein